VLHIRQELDNALGTRRARGVSFRIGLYLPKETHHSDIVSYEITGVVQRSQLLRQGLRKTAVRLQASYPSPSCCDNPAISSGLARFRILFVRYLSVKSL